MHRKGKDIRYFLSRHNELIIPLVLAGAILITAVIGLIAHGATAGLRSSQASTQSAVLSPEGLEKNAHEDVDELISRYYSAMATGDTDTIESISSGLSDEEKIRITELAKYVESYPSIDVYTQAGPETGSYICYVVTEMKFEDHDWQVPGMQTLYVCTKDDGTLYINNTEDQTQEVTDYIQKAALDDDVVDLSNKVTADYNRLLQQNADLASYLDELSTNIDISVGQALAQLQNASTENSAEEEYKDKQYLIANDVVNVRRTAGEDGEKIGETVKGNGYEVIEYDPDGWSKIVYNGEEGYVKSEYFTLEASSETQSASGSDTEASGAE